MGEPEAYDDRLMRIVREAMHAPANARDAVLRARCASDDRLLADALAHIEAEERMTGFLSAPLFSAVDIDRPFEPAEIINGNFILIRELGRGGMGIVYEALDVRLETKVALKCAKPGFERRLPPEVRLARQVAHRNVCRVYAIDSTHTRHGDVEFATMELLEGETLAARIRRSGRISQHEVKGMARQLCAGLEEAHHESIIHGDLNSRNIFLVDDGHNNLKPVISDFGLARRVGRSHAREIGDVVGGTPGYMAPELRDGATPTIASDIYALGAILYQACTGRVPAAIGARELTKALAPNTGRQMCEAICRCLETDPVLRPGSAAEVARLIERRSPAWRIALAAASVAAIAAPWVGPDKDEVRLAIMPFDSPQQSRSLFQGVLIETGKLLTASSPSGRGFSLIPVAEFSAVNAHSWADAGTKLGATTVLTGAFRQDGELITGRAALIDTRTQHTLKELEFEDPKADLSRVPVLLAGLATSTLGLPPVRVRPAVQPDAYQLYTSGRAHLEREAEIDPALADLEQARARDRHSPLICALLVQAYLTKFRLTADHRFLESARAAASAAESINPDLASVRAAAGMVHLEDGRYSEAAADFRRAIELNPGEPDHHWALANALHGLNDDRESIAAYRRAIEMQPGYFRAYRQLGKFYYDSGNYTAASDQFRRVVELTPGAYEGHVLLGVALLRQCLYAQSETEFRAALAIQESVDALADLGAVLDLVPGREQEAIGYHLKAIGISPYFYVDWSNLGDCYRRTGQETKAVQAYRTGLELARKERSEHPHDVYARASTGYLLARLGNAEQARDEIEQARHELQVDPSAKRMIIRAYGVLNDSEGALQVLRSAPRTMLCEVRAHPDLGALRAYPAVTELLNNSGP